MEILKKIGIILTLCLSTTHTFSQDYKKDIKSFQNSYINEANGNYKQAIADLKENYKTDSYEYNLRLGWLTYSSGSYTESKNYYKKAISLKPFAIEPRFGIVMPQSALGNWTAVIAQYKKIMEISPNNSIAIYRLGLVYYGQENYTEAEKLFEKVVNLYPFDYDALLMYAWTNYQLKKYREAKVLFNKTLMNTPTSKSALEGLELVN